MQVSGGQKKIFYLIKKFHIIENNMEQYRPGTGYGPGMGVTPIGPGIPTGTRLQVMMPGQQFGNQPGIPPVDVDVPGNPPNNKDLLPLLAAITPILQSLIHLYGERRRRKADEKQARESQQFELDMWERQMEYNHPAAQMERLMKAGLNPHLMYGDQPRHAAGTVQDRPSPHSPTYTNELAQFNIPHAIELIKTLSEARIAEQHARTAPQEAWIRERQKAADMFRTETAAEQESFEFNMRKNIAAELIREDKIRANMIRDQARRERALREISEVQAKLEKQFGELGMTSKDDMYLRSIIVAFQQIFGISPSELLPSIAPNR